MGSILALYRPGQGQVLHFFHTLILGYRILLGYEIGENRGNGGIKGGGGVQGEISYSAARFVCICMMTLNMALVGCED